ncbi:MAG: hypothetical protein HFJ38_06470 [Bacilli bacterium]|nr:hypothetical protein [Bacilli bacterium]
MEILKYTWKIIIFAICLLIYWIILMLVYEKDNYCYIISKNPEQEKELDNIERYVYNWVFNVYNEQTSSNSNYNN